MRRKRTTCQGSHDSVVCRRSKSDASQRVMFTLVLVFAWPPYAVSRIAVCSPKLYSIESSSLRVHFRPTVYAESVLPVRETYGLVAQNPWARQHIYLPPAPKRVAMVAPAPRRRDRYRRHYAA